MSNVDKFRLFSCVKFSNMRFVYVVPYFLEILAQSSTKSYFLWVVLWIIDSTVISSAKNTSYIIGSNINFLGLSPWEVMLGFIEFELRFSLIQASKVCEAILPIVESR
jgi:hypothetical protein